MKKAKKVLSTEYVVRFNLNPDLNQWDAMMDGNPAKGLGATCSAALDDLMLNINNHGMRRFIVERLHGKA